MSDYIVKRLRDLNDHMNTFILDEAADRIEELECEVERLTKVTSLDADWLAAYHKWCEMNGCAPSSSDLIAAIRELEKNDE